MPSSDFSSSDPRFVYSFGSEFFIEGLYPLAIASVYLVSITLWNLSKSQAESVRNKVASNRIVHLSRVKTPEAKN